VIWRLPLLPPHPPLQRAGAVLVGALAPWLAARPAHLERGFRQVLRSLNVPEEGRTWSMQAKGADHVGVVALSKLVAVAGLTLASAPGLLNHLLGTYLSLAQGRYR
ncbi:unnamed protein product, partial [Discosporangium mesarthrocarpum]